MSYRQMPVRTCVSFFCSSFLVRPDIEGFFLMQTLFMHAQWCSRVLVCVEGFVKFVSGNDRGFCCVCAFWVKGRGTDEVVRSWVFFARQKPLCFAAV